MTMDDISTYYQYVGDKQDRFLRVSYSEGYLPVYKHSVLEAVGDGGEYMLHTTVEGRIRRAWVDLNEEELNEWRMVYPFALRNSEYEFCNPA